LSASFVGLVCGWSVSLFTVLPQEFWPQLVEQSFQSLAVAQSLPQLRHELSGNIHTATSAFVIEGQDVGGVLVALGTSRTVRANTGFANLGQRPLDGRPEFFELLEKTLAEVGIAGNWICHCVCISYNIHTHK